MIRISTAVADDAGGMSTVLAEILTEWGSQRPSSPRYILEHYIEHPDGINCSVAKDVAGGILGFQSLKIASEKSPYDLPKGWGIIGTYVASNVRGTGVGKALFTSSREAALLAGLSEIDATIGDKNKTALAYYQAMGFESYRTLPGAIGKRMIVK